MLIPEGDDVFSDAYAVSETTARRIVADMARKSLRVCLAATTGADRREAFVIDELDGDESGLLLKQLEQGADSEPVLVAGKGVTLWWSDGGARHWARGSVVRVDERERAYEVRLDDGIYRAQQRAMQRIPVTSADSITAQLYVDCLGDLIDATVKDLSIAGCRLALDAQRMRYREPEPYHRSSINLVCSPGGQMISTDARIVWAARVSANTMHVSVAWVEPSEIFLGHVKRYVAQKISVM